MYISILCVCKGELLVKTYICVYMHTMALSLPISLQEFKHPVFPLSNYLGIIKVLKNHVAAVT